MLSLLLAGLLQPSPVPAGAGGSSCFGRTPTMSGTGGHDRLRGTPAPDVIVGLAGRDRIWGLGDDDFVCGGPGSDRLFGGEGTDNLQGGPGRDILIGGPGDDGLAGGGGDDACFLGSSARSCAPTIAAAGDIACDPDDGDFNDGEGTAKRCRQQATSDLIVGTTVRRVLVLGDTQYETGLMADFRASYDPSWGRFRWRTRAVPGNHEYISGGDGYFDYFGRRGGRPSRGYHDSRLGGWHLVGLNSNCGAVGGCGAGSRQLRWLKRRLSRVDARCTLAFTHHPRFSSGLHGPSGEMAPFFRRLFRNRAELLLSGHEHDYERFAPMRPDARRAPRRGLRQFVVGTGGKDLRPFEGVHRGSQRRSSSAHGVLELALLPKGYVWLFVSAPGSSFRDLGSGDCR